MVEIRDSSGETHWELTTLTLTITEPDATALMALIEGAPTTESGFQLMKAFVY